MNAPLHRQHGVRPIPNLVSITRDYGAAHAEAELERICRERPPLRPYRHDVLDHGDAATCEPLNTDGYAILAGAILGILCGLALLWVLS